LWPQKGHPFLSSYLELIDRSYGATATPLDYASDKDGACKTINGWVDGKTQHKITNLIAPLTVSAETQMILVNAIYFRGRWADDFQPRLTTEQEFHVTPNQTAKCQMMCNTDRFPYAEDDEVQVLGLPYAGNDIVMLVILPRKVDGIGALERGLSPQKLVLWEGNLRGNEVRVHLPKFKITSSFSLANALTSMGITLAFSKDADFSGMDGRQKGLAISAVIHKEYVDVNEEGTEAAAATAVQMMEGAMYHPKELVFTANYPFLFLIAEKRTGSMLFFGRVTKP
jgi:serpin B